MRAVVLAGLLLLPGPAAMAADPHELIAPCLECHEQDEGAPAGQVLLGSHGIDGEDMDARRGCLDCHGDSAGHIAAPEKQGPDVSFGPRWSAAPAEQDAPCLTCHEDNVAKHWRHALHMVNNMTCITCHDIHSEQDRVLVPEEQSAICTTCHKAQKSGIHDRGEGFENDPPCSLCHNPHNHEAAEPQMHANHSAGCMLCHAPEPGAPHETMAQGARDCLDCHQGIAHAPEDSAPPLHPSAVRGRGVTLFYPGHAGRDWLLRDHPGSQPLRQGTDCQRCHRGDEAEIGAAMAPDLDPASRVVGIAFAANGDELVIELNWSGTREDRQLALMWGGPQSTEFSHGGCFAACHDETGAHDYTMGGLTETVERWAVQLDTGEVDSKQVGSAGAAGSRKAISATVHYENGQWHVSLAVNLGQTGTGVHFNRTGRYTFGMALHTAHDSGREHLVSLPMSLGFGTTDTEFTVQ
jgi:predicted CXXCH cytochrome family protein